VKSDAPRRELPSKAGDLVWLDRRITKKQFRHGIVSEPPGSVSNVNNLRGLQIESASKTARIIAFRCPTD
jgi:hypothetical protein